MADGVVAVSGLPGEERAAGLVQSEVGGQLLTYRTPVCHGITLAPSPFPHAAKISMRVLQELAEEHAIVAP